MTQAAYSHGVTSSGMDILRADVVRELIVERANTQLVGSAAVAVRPTEALDFKFDIPKSVSIAPTEVTEGAEGDLERLGFFQTSFSLNKYQTKIRVLDESKVRGIAGAQLEFSIDACAQGLAEKIDTEIFTALAAGAYSGNAVTAENVWDEPDGADVAKDVNTLIGKFISNAGNITNADLRNLVIFYPATMLGFLSTPVQYGDAKIGIDEYFARKFGINFIWTKELTNTAIGVIKSYRTAMHYQYVGSAMPIAEYDRISGVGDQYTLTHLFNTKVLPGSNTESTSYRIGVISGIDD